MENINEIDKKYQGFNDELFFENTRKIREINENIKDKANKYFIATYGCQMNEHDSEKIAWILEEMGYSRTEIEEEADFLIFNTCAIRENAELKVYGKVGSLKTLKEENPNIKVAICGCMMQIDEIRQVIEDKHRHVDIIFGTHNVHKLPALLLERLNTGKMVIDIMEDNLDIVEGIGANRISSHMAYVNIMYGCNNFCTYCVVPYARGREISRDPIDIISEVKRLVFQGYKEIMLLGQNVNSYGKTLDIDYNFTDLLTDINDIDGLERLRFMTSHPKDISEELMESYRKLDKLANHLHLPVQSGSNEILKVMNRNYTKEKYLKDIEKVREISPNISISTDIIIGFPGETEEDFLQTLELIKEVRYDFVYNFIYSMRPGTKAAKMENQIPYEIKHERFERLNNEINKIMLEKNKKLIGQRFNVLVEEVSKNDDSMMSGRTGEFKLIHFKGDKSLIGKIVEVEIVNVSTFSLEGIMI